MSQNFDLSLFQEPRNIWLSLFILHLCSYISYFTSLFLLRGKKKQQTCQKPKFKTTKYLRRIWSERYFNVYYVDLSRFAKNWQKNQRHSHVKVYNLFQSLITINQKMKHHFQDNIYSQTQGTQNVWPLLTGGRCSEVVFVIKSLMIL